MSYAFGAKSLDRLKECDSRLSAIAGHAIVVTPVDFTIVWGYRPRDIQDALFASGASHKRYPKSKHNYMTGTGSNIPWSRALDFAPWVDDAIPWGDTHMFALIAGVFMAVAAQGPEPIPLRWGGDWDGDGSTEDQTLMDWGHLELIV